MNWLRVLALGVVVAAMTGCSDKGEVVKEKTYTPKESVKMALEGIIKTGQGGSEIGAMMQDIDKLRADNPQLADSLSKDGESMMSMSDASKVKALAKDMLKRLEAGGSGGGTKK